MDEELSEYVIKIKNKNKRYRKTLNKMSFLWSAEELCKAGRKSYGGKMKRHFTANGTEKIQLIPPHKVLEWWWWKKEKKVSPHPNQITIRQNKQTDRHALPDWPGKADQSQSENSRSKSGRSLTACDVWKSLQIVSFFFKDVRTPPLTSSFILHSRTQTYESEISQ